MKSFQSNLSTKPSLVRVIIAALLAGVALVISPAVVSFMPFPPELGPFVMVLVPALILKLIHYKLSVITIIIGTAIASLLITDINELLVAQLAHSMWLSTVLFLGGFIVLWFGALSLCAWLARLVIAHRERGQHMRAIAIVTGLAVLVVIGLVGLNYIIVSRPVYNTAAMSQSQVDERKARILAIYASLNLDDKYQLVNEDVFGEKRVYSWDTGRTFSSSRKYVRDAEVDATLAEVRPKIEQAGFTFVGEPYPNAVDKQLHFRSAKGEYIRLTISSKPRDDAVMAARGKNLDFNNLPSGAPSYVLVKVNLDDNNE